MLRTSPAQAGPKLLDLPVELLDVIIGELDVLPLSLASVPCLEGLAPQAKLVDKAADEDTPLKALSLTCRALRGRTLGVLMKCARIRSWRIQTPTNNRELTTFLEFLNRQQLYTAVKSLLVISLLGTPSATSLNPIDCEYTWSYALPKLTSIESISILAPPNVLGELLLTTVDMRDGWAFAIPLQYLRVSTNTPPTATSRERPHTNPPSSLMAARPWTKMALHEGSAIRHYSVYDFFEKSMPSVISGLLLTAATATTYSGPLLQFADLTSFTYIAEFPPASHIAGVLRMLAYCSALQSLCVELIPLTHSRQDYWEIEGLKINPADAWTEAGAGYSKIALLLRQDPIPYLKDLSRFESRGLYQMGALAVAFEQELPEGQWRESEVVGGAGEERSVWVRAESGE